MALGTNQPTLTAGGKVKRSYQPTLKGLLRSQAAVAGRRNGGDAQGKTVEAAAAAATAESVVTGGHSALEHVRTSATVEQSRMATDIKRETTHPQQGSAQSSAAGGGRLPANTVGTSSTLATEGLAKQPKRSTARCLPAALAPKRPGLGAAKQATLDMHLPEHAARAAQLRRAPFLRTL